MAPPRHTADTPLKPKHQKLLAAYLRLGSVNAAAREIGISKAGASAVLNTPHMRKELDRVRKEIVVQTKYDVVAAMKNLEDAAVFARETENAGALVKAHELMMKLHGLLIERVDQRQVGAFTIAIRGIDDEPEKVPAKFIDIPPDDPFEGL